MHETWNLQRLADEIINGRRLTREDDLQQFITCDLEELCSGADRIRRALCGDKVDLCTIINGKAGRCSEDCKFCAQSAHNHSNCEVYSFLDKEVILAEAKANQAEGVDRFSIVTAAKTLNGEDFEKAIEAFRLLHEECDLDLCASMGLLSREQLQPRRRSVRAQLQPRSRWVRSLISLRTSTKRSSLLQSRSLMRSRML